MLFSETNLNLRESITLSKTKAVALVSKKMNS